MTSQQLKIELSRLSMSETQLADLAGVSRTAVWYWLNGKRPVPEYVQTILKQHKTLTQLSKR